MTSPRRSLDRQEIINNIIALVHKKVAPEQAKLVEPFVRQYYATMAEEDLCLPDILDLYGAALSHWNFLYERKSGEMKVRVFNPLNETHGWQSLHTIVEIAFDDYRFAVDSVRMELNRHGLTVHLINHPAELRFQRDANGRIIKVFENGSHDKNASNELAIYVEIDQLSDTQELENLQADLLQVLEDVRITNNDWRKMRDKALEIIAGFEKSCPATISKEDFEESLDFLRWIASDNFTFIGYREYSVTTEKKSHKLQMIPESGLGLLSVAHTKSSIHPITDLTPELRDVPTEKPDLLVMQQLTFTSPVHRPAEPYYIGIRFFNEKGEVVGERRFIGLFTSIAYHSSVQEIPILRRKADRILEKSALPADGYSWKVLLNILESYPRDEVIQASVDELLSIVMGIYNLQERARTRLFIRKDVFGRFFSCVVFTPRDRFDSILRAKMGEILRVALNGHAIAFSTQLSESILARIHFIIRVKPEMSDVEYNIEDLEAQLTAAGRTWTDELKDSMLETFGEANANALYRKYSQAFPASYREDASVRTAINDIGHMEALSETERLGMNLFRSLEDFEGTLHFKIFSVGQTRALSEVLPMLEHMGLKVISERNYEITLAHGQCIWINDFSMSHISGKMIDVDLARDNFQQAFSRVLMGDIENDRFNNLILSSGLNWRETALLRTYSRYFRQIGFTFSQSYVADTLRKYPDIARLIVKLFHTKFDPSTQRGAKNLGENIADQIVQNLDSVSGLEEDRILRRYLELIQATIRTNFYQNDLNNSPKSYISLKFDPKQIPGLVEPKPMFEIFVYSPRVEGVHLRSGKVARGGLRWSDRKEDYRTEVLGLMKAQQVKNSVIVPAGAKGGFICKNLPKNGSRDEMMAEVVSSYSTFVRGLLDLTDNLGPDGVIPPLEVVRHDGDDFYLVVAADKGTATFSDIANGIAQEYGFWLSGAFASGGSVGYDHKKMGITARGAWESVKRHFRELDMDIQNQDFTCVGIGDMSGDVFGNGMLLSKHLRLVAAFNHQHIFLDPNANAEVSFEERQRLFNLPRSTWADYNPKLISKGGGVYSRAAKSIELTEEVKTLLQIKDRAMMPSDLIRAILKAPIDLLWNGGIGTYIKANYERNSEVGDRANDALRVDGRELRCKVIGEGGNLGCTQLGRVEYALNGGIGFTDFIDNVGGVDCSDHEVNIKILLDSIVSAGDMTYKQRNILLADMTDEVSELVLYNNRRQPMSISHAAHRATSTVDEYQRFIHSLERQGQLDRAIEFLPSDDIIAERKAEAKGLTRPEISVIMAYSKIWLKSELLKTDVPEDPYIAQFLKTAFPKTLDLRFPEQMKSHRLRREIISTQLSNVVVNDMGATFVKRLYDETGAPASTVARYFAAVRDIFEMQSFWDAMENINPSVPSKIQLEMMTEVIRLVRRATRWFLRNRRVAFDIAEAVDHFKPKVKELNSCIHDLLQGPELQRYEDQYNSFVEVGVTAELATQVAGTSAMISSMDIIEAATVNNLPVCEVAGLYFALGARLELDWFRNEIGQHRVSNNWDALARAACRDDLDRQQRGITEGVLKYLTQGKTQDEAISSWLTAHKILLERWFYLLNDLKATKSREFTMFAVALRELLDLAQASTHATALKAAAKAG